MSDQKLPPFLKNPGFLLSRVGTAVQGEFKDVLARWELKPLHFLVLSALKRGGGASQQELCNQLTIDSGNMVQLLDRLEELGFASRAADPRDRRRHIVTITTAGKESLTAIHAAVEELHAEFFSPLGQAEQQQLVETLAKLYLRTAEGRREAPPIGLSAANNGRHG